MRIEEFEKEYQVREFQAKSGVQKTELSWKFKQASHFLIFVYDSRYPFALEEAVEMLEAERIADVDIVESRSSDNVYRKENGKFQLFCIREKEFVQNKKTMSIAAQQLKKSIPYEISVFSCDYDEDAEELSVFLPERPEDNKQYIPVKIVPEITYEKKFLSKNTTCILKILPKLEDYKDGAIMYHVEGVRADIPLSAASLGRELYISVPAKDSVTVRIREEYKKYYKKSEGK